MFQNDKSFCITNHTYIPCTQDQFLSMGINTDIMNSVCSMHMSITINSHVLRIYLFCFGVLILILGEGPYEML